MYWLRRPPYLRWLVAGFILLVALALEVRPVPTVSYPFAADNLGPGDPIQDSVVWREVPAGMLPGWSGEPAGPISVGLLAGDPIVPSAFAAAVVPDGWWAVQVPLPAGSVGSRLRVILGEGRIAEGVVVEAFPDDGFEPTGMVAFPPTDAPLVAMAAANDALTVMIGVGSGTAGRNG